jgi:3-oxoacyl-[acyl-carrier protein] reductase
LRDDGYEVIIGYNRSREEALALAAEIGAAVARADMRDTGEVERMVADAGRIDALVCAAGVSRRGLLTDMVEDEWSEVLDVNVAGAIRCCRAAIPRMVSAKTGSIITISSVWGMMGASCEAVYAASKAAIIGLTKSLAKELGPSGIRVNCVAPGVIRTDMNKSLTDEDMEALRTSTPLGVIGSPSDVARLVCFLASDSAGFITGQVVGADGGFPY